MERPALHDVDVVEIRGEHDAAQEQDGQQERSGRSRVERPLHRGDTIERGEIVFAGKPSEVLQNANVLRIIGGAA
jgi:hypothetical protein